MYSDNFRFCQADEVHDGGGHDRGLPSGTPAVPKAKRPVEREANARGWPSPTVDGGAVWSGPFNRVEASAICVKPARLSARRRVLDIAGARRIAMPGLVRIEHAPGPYCSGRSRSKDQHTKLLGIYLSQRACTHLRSSPLELGYPWVATEFQTLVLRIQVEWFWAEAPLSFERAAQGKMSTNWNDPNSPGRRARLCAS